MTFNSQTAAAEWLTISSLVQAGLHVSLSICSPFPLQHNNNLHHDSLIEMIDLHSYDLDARSKVPVTSVGQKQSAERGIMCG